MDMEPALQIFVTESSELLEEAESALLELDANPDDAEQVDGLFRAFHTIKGSAGMFGFDTVVAFTHGVESLLGRVREGNQKIQQDLVSLFLSCRDHIALLIGNAMDESVPLTPEQIRLGEQLTSRLDAYLEGICSPVATGVAKGSDTSITAVKNETAGTDHWHISLRFEQDALRNGMEPLSFIRFLGKTGDIIGLKVLDGQMPPVTEMDPESCYLGFEIAFCSAANREEIEDVFEFARDDCEIVILAPASPISAYRELLERRPEETLQMTALLMELGTLTGQGTSTESPSQPTEGDKSREFTQTSRPAVTSVRVDAARLEALINQVGELVISGAGIQQHADRIGDPALLETMENMSRLVEEIRDTSLGLRMMQIGETFNRFRRIVRDISQKMDKEIELQISGGDAELDKTMVEKISDPLTHLVRNAIDHGIETTQVRRVAGKPLKGTLSLNAHHDSGSIIIEVSDDGGGLSREKILAKAEERGLVKADKNLTDQEVYQLIFEPGFSTAEQVTKLSGRGVGMDVVRSNIDALRGQVEIESRPGEGSAFRIRLPLTLAIIDGFQVRVGDTHYVIPLDMVVECVELPHDTRDSMSESAYIQLREKVLPFVRLNALFNEKENPAPRSDIVVVRYAGQTVGLLVDQLLGEHQTVIKPLGKVFRNLRGISGATILGSGEVAMIIDVPELVQKVIAQEMMHPQQMMNAAEPMH